MKRKFLSRPISTISHREDVVDNLKRLLKEALAMANFTAYKVRRPYAADDIRALHRLGTLQQYIGVSATIPDGLKKRLVDEIGLQLRDYVHPETRCVGNGLAHVLGGVLNPPSLEGFVDSVVCTAAALGTDRAVQLLSDWSEGKPALYQRRAVLFGGKVDRPIELPQEGIQIDSMPTSFDELSSVVPITLKYVVSSMGSSSVLGMPVLSVACSDCPVLYMPVGDTGLEFRREWAYGKLPKFSMDAFCEALSLAGNGCIQPKYEWPHAPELRLFVPGGVGSTSRTGVPDARRTITLTQRHLEHARELFLIRNDLPEKTRRSLSVSIHRWIKSKGESSTQNRLIELRIALEALYLKDVGGEMSYRIATRGAWHLGGNQEERRTTFSILRNVYDLASKVVHARNIGDTDEKQNKILEDGQDVCRRGILMVLKQNEPNWDELILGIK